MTRFAAVWHDSPTKVLTTLLALSIAGAIVVGSGANFTSTSANPANTFTAGNLSQGNSKSGSAVLSATGMKPGDATTGTVEIANDGDIPGVFTLASSGLAETAGTGGGLLSTKLDLVIRDQGDPAAPSAPGTVVYSGKLGALGTQSLGTFAVGEAHRYHFTVTFPDGGAGGADNAYKKASTSLQFDWVSTETP